MPGGLQFVLILPDGSKSLIPADWTDFNSASSASQALELVGSLDDLLRLRRLVDALLRRATDVPLTSGAAQESHAATESKLQRHPDFGDVPVGTVRRRAKADRHREPGAPPCQSHPGQEPGADQ
jgi:hypothetical protein